jgi:hypothetical protein
MNQMPDTPMRPAALLVFALLLVGHWVPLRAQLTLPTLMDLGFKQAQVGLHLRVNHLPRETGSGATEATQIQPSLILGYNLRPRAPWGFSDFIGAKSTTGKKLTFYTVVDGASLRLALPNAPNVGGQSFRPLELHNYDQYAFFELVYKRRNIRRLDLGLYRLLNFTAGLSMASHRMDFSALPRYRERQGSERPVIIPKEENFTSMTLTIGAEYMPRVVVNDWVPSFHAANYIGRWWNKNTNANLTGWDRRHPAGYAVALRPYFRFTRLLGSSTPQIDQYLEMNENADFRWLIGPGLVVDATYEWVSIYARVSRVWALGSGGIEIPGLTSESHLLCVGLILNPSWTRCPQRRLLSTGLQWK